MKIVKHSVLILILITAIIHECSSGPNEKRLLHHLIDKYNYLERPVATESDTLVVSVNVKLNWQAQQIGANFIFRYEWQDENLQWNATEFGGIKRINISPNRIWKHSVRISKEANGDSGSVCWDSNAVRLNGTVTQEHAIKLELICSISAIDFPFEEHECKLELFSSAHTPQEVVFTTYGGQDEGDISEFTPTPEFQLLGFPVKVINNEKQSRVSYLIKIRRHGDFHFKFVLIYCTIASSMIILSCLASPTSPYKLLMSLLGIATCIFSINDIVSRACTYSHNNTPIRIVEFFTNLLLLSLLSFISNSLVIYMYNLHRKMPAFLSNQMKHINRSNCSKSTGNTSDFNEGINEKGKKIAEPSDEIGLSDIVKNSSEETQNYQQKFVQYDWQILALMVDRIMFTVWILVVVIFLIFCFPKYNPSK